MSLRLFVRVGIIVFVLGIFLAVSYKKEDKHIPQLKALTKDAPSLLPSNNYGYTVKHKHFTLSYSEEHEQAEWVAYTLMNSDIQKNTKRTDKFREDPDVKTGSATLKDYRKSGYDRGHLCPSADRTISYTANSETFYMSNMSPQAPQFNRGIWKQLEEKTRDYIRSEPSFLYIVTGPVLEPGLKEIGDNGVDVPKKFYKILYNLNQASAFLFKNEGTELPLDSFLVSIDSIETITGIDFFQELPKRQQKKFEATKNSFW